MAWVPAKKIIETGGNFPVTHPFKVFLKSTKVGNSFLYSCAVAYHSTLFKNTFTDQTEYFEYQKLPIVGLDEYTTIPDPTKKNVYVTLDIGVSNLTPTEANINFLPEGSKGLAPFSFSENYEQNFAQSVIAVIVNDSESQAGTSGGGDDQTTYIVQKIFSDLIITNLIINNVPVIAAVPCWGGSIN